MDDIAFFNTDEEVFRGGIWDHSARPDVPMEPPSPSNLDISDPPIRNGTPSESVDPSEFTVSTSVDADTPLSPSTSHTGSLRHRKTTPDFRTAGLSTHTSDIHTVQPLSKSIHKSNESLTDLRKSFDLDSHIGELNPKPLTRSDTASSKATIVSAVKKWGTWYFKDRRNNNAHPETAGGGGHLPPSERQSTSDLLSKKSTSNFAANHDEKKMANSKQAANLQSSDTLMDSHKPLSAPLPHSFPPELMNVISSSNDMPVSSAMESPSRKPTENDDLSEDVPKRKKSLRATDPKPQADAESGSSDKGGTPVQEAPSTDDKEDAIKGVDKGDATHQTNPGLTLLRRPTTDTAVTIPSTVVDLTGTSPSKSIKIPSSKKGSAMSSLSSSLSSSASAKRNSLPKETILEVEPKKESEPNPDTAVSQNHETLFDMDHAEDVTAAKPTVHHVRTVKRKAVGSGPNKHPHAQPVTSNGTLPVATATEDTPQAAELLDEAPIVSSKNVHVAAEPFSVPVLAPLPPMKERTVARRPSDDNLVLDKESRPPTTPYTSSAERHPTDSVITVPMPVSSVMSYSHEKQRNDYQTGSSASFQFDPQQSPPHQEYTGPPQHAASGLKPAKSVKRKPTTSASHHNQQLQNSHSPHLTAQSPPHSPSFTAAADGEEQPILSYRKGKPKQQNQGFKFF